MRKILNTLIITLLLIPFYAQSQGLQQKNPYLIDNKNKIVGVPFDTIRVWGNYFIRYDLLDEQNKSYYNILTQKFRTDSLQEITFRNIIKHNNNIIKQDSIREKVLLLKNENLTNQKDSVTFVSQNQKYIIDTYKSKYTFSRDKDIFLKGTAFGTALGVLIKIFIFK